MSAPPPPLPAWTLPARFGKYTLLRRMAVGGMAELYLALMRGVAGFEKVVVIKRILPQMTQDPDFVEMLLSEARIAATLSHPNIAQTFDVGQHGGTYFIAMEHVHGDDIRGIVRQMKKKGHKEFPLEHAIEIIIGVCKGLSYAHEKRDFDGSPLEIVHRDISPQNVVVAFSGDAKIVDFGIAKSHSKVKFRRSEDTETGKIKGKIAYMSPEQALGQDVDTRSDIFAAGILLYELTTGRRLFRAPSDYETLKLICERDVPRPSEVRAGYSPELERIVVKALARKKADRYQTAREMQADLEAFARRHQLEASSGTLSTFLHQLYAGEPQLEHDVGLAPREVEQVLESRAAPEVEPATPESPESSTRTPSMPAAAHTVPNTASLPARKSRRVVALGAAIGIAASIALVVRAKTTDVPTASVAPARASLSVTSDPPGGTIWLDGDLRPERTPAVLDGLPVGRELAIKVTHEGFEPFVEKRSLAEGSQTLDAALVRGRLTVRVSVRPADATLSLDGSRVASSSSLKGGRSEFTLDGLSTEPHELLVSAHGHVDKRVPFTGAAFETKDLSIDLDEADAPTPASNPTASASAGKGKPSTNGPVAPASPKGKGSLNVGAAGGWCNVSVDGQPRGATPLAGLELAAGNHSVTCTSPEGKAQSSQVTVQPDSVARVKFTL